MTLTPEQRKANVARIKKLARALRDLDRNHLALAEAKAENIAVELAAIRTDVTETRAAVEEAVTVIEQIFATTGEGDASR